MSHNDFRLVSEFTNIHRRPFELVDNTILKATATNPLLMGEWLQHSGNYLMARGAEAAGSTVPSFPVFSETGRYETQALGKVPILYMNAFEADTLVFAAAGLALGSPVAVGDVTIATLTRRGLLLNPGGSVLTVGFVTRLPANNNGFLRFIRTLT